MILDQLFSVPFSPATNRAEVKERVIALTKEAHEATGFKYQQNQRA